MEGCIVIVRNDSTIYNALHAWRAVSSSSGMTAEQITLTIEGYTSSLSEMTAQHITLTIEGYTSSLSEMTAQHI